MNDIAVNILPLQGSRYDVMPCKGKIFVASSENQIVLSRSNHTAYIMKKAPYQLKVTVLFNFS